MKMTLPRMLKKGPILELILAKSTDLLRQGKWLFASVGGNKELDHQIQLRFCKLFFYNFNF